MYVQIHTYLYTNIPHLPHPPDCHDIYRRGYRTAGVYQVKPDSAAQLDNVYCEMINGTGWTLIQRRRDGTLSFNRRWLEYKYGFGNLYGEFWIGNQVSGVVFIYWYFVLVPGIVPGTPHTRGGVVDH